MENHPTKSPRIPGLTNTGTLEPDARIDDVVNQLLTLSVKSGIGAMMTAVEMGCTEHQEVITGQQTTAIVGLHCFTQALDSLAGAYSGAVVVEPNISFAKELAQLCHQEIQTINKYLERIPGVSGIVKKRFRNALNEFVIQTFAKNFPGFDVGIATIISR